MKHSARVALLLFACGLGCSSPSPPSASGADDDSSGGSSSGGSVSSAGAQTAGTSGNGGGAGSAGAVGVAGSAGVSPGGASGSGGSGCTKVAGCNYESEIHPTTVSMKDQQSYRSDVGYYCYDTSSGSTTPTWTTEQECDYSEQCMLTAVNGVSTPSCVSCGDRGRRTSTSTIDGAPAEDVAGCLVTSWRIDGCYTDTTNYGEPYALFEYYFTGTQGLIIAVTPSGKLFFLLDNTPIPGAVQNANINIVKGGLVELDVTIDYDYVDTYQMSHHLHVVAHLVDTCP